MIPIWVLFYHDLLGVVILLTVAYWALSQRDRSNKRFSDLRAEIDEVERTLGQVRDENAKVRRENGRLRTEKQVLMTRLKEIEVTDAELEMLARFKRGDGNGVVINAHEVTIGGDVAGRDMAD